MEVGCIADVAFEDGLVSDGIGGMSSAGSGMAANLGDEPSSAWI